MPDDEARIKATLDFGGQESVERSTVAVRTLKAETDRSLEGLEAYQAASRRLAAQILNLTEEQGQLTVAFANGELAMEAYLTQMNGLDRQIAPLHRELNILTTAIEEAAGTEAAVGGFAGLSKGAFEAERAFTALATGTGLARAGPMLERVSSALGMTSGVGFAIVGLAFALETVIPKLAKFFDLWDEEKIKALADHASKMADAVDKMSKARTTPEEEQAKDVATYLKVAGERQITQAVGMTLTEQGFGISAEDQKTLAMIADKRAKGEWVEPALIGEEQRILEAQQKAVTTRTGELITTLPTSVAARREVAGMARARPGLFPTELAEGLGAFEPEAREADRQEMQRLEDEESERQGRKQARFDRNRAWNREQADKRKQTEEKDRETDRLNTIARQNEDWMRHQTETEARKDEAQKRRDEARQAAEARRNTPEAINLRQRQEEANRAMAATQQFAPMLAPDIGSNATIQAAIAKHAAENHRLGQDLMLTVQQAIAIAIEQTRGDILRGAQAGMNQQFHMMPRGPGTMLTRGGGSGW